MNKTFLDVFVALTAVLFSLGVQANNKVVVIPLGGDSAALLERTVFVTGGGTDTENGSALIDAFAFVADKNPSVDDPWVIRLEPGTFNVESAALNLTSGMNIDGSGKDVSRVLGVTAFAVMTVDSLASTISSLTVENAQGSGFVISGTAASSFRIHNSKILTNGASAIVTSGTSNIGVVEIANSTIEISSVGNDLRFLRTRQNVNVDSSRIIGIETGSSGLIDNLAGTVTISNSFIQDETNVVGGTGTVNCRGVASPGAFYTNLCPGE